jgi:glyoxylase-like metal-dependent hydrolase (beta-lactamase superfamily II)
LRKKIYPKIRNEGQNALVTKEIIHHQDLLEWYWAADNELIPKPFFTSCYLLDGVLIDTGAPKGEKDFRNFVSSKLVNNQINKCLITHTHEDHIGGVHVVSEEFQIPVYASIKALPLLETANTYVYAEYRDLYWGSGLHSVKAEPIPTIIHSESHKYALTVLSVPGHAPEQIALLEPSQEWVFVADAVLPKYQVLFGYPCNIQEDIALIYASIRSIYNATEGMGNLKVFVSGKGVFEGRGYLKARLEEIKSLHTDVHAYKAKGLTPEQILEEIYGGEGLMGIMTNGELSHLNLINSLLRWNE